MSVRARGTSSASATRRRHERLFAMTKRPASPESVQLGIATWTDVSTSENGPPIVAIPIGSCEQHGPHLPLDTDLRIACAIANELSAAIPRVLVGPPITISASGEHHGFAGTLSIGASALELVLIELVRSADWTAGVVFVNGHGGNVGAVNNALAVLGSEGRRVLSWWPRVDGGDAHAGRSETSLMLAIDPETVRESAAEPGRTEPINELLPALHALGVAAVSPNGVLGDPRGATATEGAEILRTLVLDAISRVQAWVATSPGATSPGATSPGAT